jgi:predicted O-methyltransferase YrrM
MIALIKAAIKPIVRKAAELNAQMKLGQIRTIDAPAADKIANVIYDAINYNAVPHEKEWIVTIEELRAKLSSSSEEVIVIDYGAGSPTQNRSSKDMEQGTVSTSTVSNISKASKAPFWSLLLFKLVREFQPLTCIELGTCVGISAAYQAAAQHLNGKGKLITIEGSASIAAIAKHNLERLGLNNAVVITGRFQDTLDQALQETGPVDYAFIDGHHDGSATKGYFEQLIPHLDPKALLIFDDISWSDDMSRAWRQIIQKDLVKISINLRVLGICVIDSDIEGKSHFNLPLF